MARKMTATKSRLIQCAFELFSKDGYNNTTIERIIAAAGCSKGTFYHYFSGKEELLISWNHTLDTEYLEWFESLSEKVDAVEKLKAYNKMVLGKMEFESDLESISTLYASQLNLRDERLIARSNTNYHSILNQILKEGQLAGEIRDDVSFMELSKMFTTILRGVVYEWCISAGSYSLREFGVKTMNLFLENYRSDNGL